MNQSSFVCISDYSKEKILRILAKAAEFEATPNRNLLENKVVATLVFENQLF